MVALTPTLLLSGLLASAYALLFHLLWGHTVRQLVRLWLLAIIGFGLGQVVAMGMGWGFSMVGDVHVVEGTVGAWAALIIAKWQRL
jgi:hypothetical protein